MSVEPNYSVVFTVKPSVRMLFNCDFVINEKEDTIRIIATDLLAEDDNNKSYPIGTRIDIRIHPENAEESIAKANSYAGAFMSILSFTANTEIGNIQTETAWEITNVRDTRNVLQFFHDLPLPSPSSGKLDKDIFVDIVGKLIEEKSEYSSRIYRAIAYYSKGLKEIHPLDHFTSFWVGLEALNEPLRKMLSAPHDIQRCGKCGHETKRNAVTGVRAFMTIQIPDGENIFKRTRNMRVDIMHSTKELLPLLPEISKLSDDLQEILRKAIFYTMNISFTGNVVRPAIKNLVPHYVAIEANVSGMTWEDNVISSEEYPHFVVTEISFKTNVKSDGEVTLMPKASFKLRGIPIKQNGE